MTLQTLKSKIALKHAEDFLRECVRGGLAHSFDTASNAWVKPYPEVTGYILSYFSHYHSRESARWITTADKLVNLQDATGGFPSFYDQDMLYAFDTAQIMHGLLSMYARTGITRYIQSARRAGDFLCFMQISHGLMFPLFNTNDGTRIAHRAMTDGRQWGSTFSYIQVKNAEGLLLLAKVAHDKKYEERALSLAMLETKRVDYRYTHPLGYYLEGLWALGKEAQVARILEQKVIPRLKPNGFIPYFPGAPYAYTSGSVQLGILLAKTGHLREARQILAWASRVQAQHASGGLFQYANSSGEPDASVHREINSWGTKYFAELIRLVG